MEKQEIIKNISAVIRRYLPGADYKIFLFGSWAKGGAEETSDIDVGILGKEKIPWDIMARILGEVKAIPTLRKIDVVDLNLVEDSFKNNVLEYAKPL